MPRANDETLLMCQIESRRGVENIEAILAVEGIDVGFIGPNDMTRTMASSASSSIPTSWLPLSA